METIEQQLQDLLDMLGEVEPGKDGAAAEVNRKTLGEISPLERMLQSRPIWYLPSTTREEAVQLLHNKHTGNFVVRGSRQPRTLALSLVLAGGPGERAGPVEHFILEQRGGRVGLQDSDLQFDNIVSLAFHYSRVAEELPVLLTLPAVLAGAASTQQLTSLALLGPAFWSYPMARSDRSSVCLPGVTTTPPRAPARLQARPAPAAPHRPRRASDTTPFITQPARAVGRARHSVAGPAPALSPASAWVTSPLQPSPPAPRARKVSVFGTGLGGQQSPVLEAVYEEVADQQTRRGRQEYSDYSEPVDSIDTEESDISLYENPSSPVKPRDEDNCRVEVAEETEEGPGLLAGFHPGHHPGPSLPGRKLSLGQLLRRLSSGSLGGPAPAQPRPRKASLQEKRMSTALTRLLALPGGWGGAGKLGHSYQVDSSSWEFLNQEQPAAIRAPAKLPRAPSLDSLYESEFDSSSTLESCVTESSGVLA